MGIRNAVAEHYNNGDIIGRILEGFKRAGIDRNKVTLEDLGKVDEFHVGGRKASEHFFAELGFRRGSRLLDVGCGTGGSARFASASYDVEVVGIDLTEGFVKAGNELSSWVGMKEAVVLQTGEATSLPFDNEQFEGAYTMHVCMNIKDKFAVFNEVFRTLKPGGVFGIYDIMKYQPGELNYPVPWAGSSETSFLEAPESYRKTLESAGFSVEKVNNRHEFAVEFFENVKAGMAGSDGPPPVGIHLHMGVDAPRKVANLTEGLSKKVIAPFEIISRKPGL